MPKESELRDGEQLPVHEVLSAIDGSVTITRDDFGIPAICATTATDAWWGLGFAAAGDRLWQLEYDRRRAAGRWAEAAGESALDSDILSRRLRIERAAKADVEAMDADTARAFEAYAAGVNAGALARELPPEYALCGIEFEPWMPWHSVAAFKIRHLLMGVWQYKLLRAILLANEGEDAFEALDPISREGMLFTTPSGSRQHSDIRDHADLWARSYGDIAAAAEQLGFLSEVEAGSNAWVVAGSRTTTGMPVLCNDAHRAADVPNVYWQASVSCDEFTVAGPTLPGIPGFPHFGSNGRVGWAITNATADAQDLILENFRDSVDGITSRTADGWAAVDTVDELIRIRGAVSGNSRVVLIQTHATPSGVVIHGDPISGAAISLRWTATDRICRQFGVLGAMVRSTTVDELIAAHEPWVDPVNNLLCADVDGNIGYLLRGQLPARRDPAAARLPVPAWEWASGWDGTVPFDRMPREKNPPNGYFANANNTVTSPDDILVSHSVNDFYRIERITEMLGSTQKHAPADLAAMQNDSVSIAARTWSAFLDGDKGFIDNAAASAELLRDWDGDLSADRPAPLLYAHFRRALVRLALPRIVSQRTANKLLAGTLPSSWVILKRWFAQMAWSLGRDGELPAPLDHVLVSHALSDALDATRSLAGDQPSAWSWPAVHRLAPQHTLAKTELAGILRNPNPVSVTGDSDAVANGAYGWAPGSPFAVTNTSVCRQVIDFAQPSTVRWAIPGGASGDPRSRHYDDQLPVWAGGALLVRNNEKNDPGLRDRQSVAEGREDKDVPW